MLSQYFKLPQTRMTGKSLNPPSPISPASPRQLLIVLLFGCMGCLFGGSAAGSEPNSHEIAPGVFHVHELSIAVSCAESPFYGFDGFEGREWELIKTALSKAGHKARLYYLASAEGFSALQKGMVDAVWTCGSIELPPNGNYLSAPLLPRQCVAISLASSSLQIDTFEDLAGKKVAFHPSLHATLEPVLKKILAINPLVQSVSNHSLLAMFLFNGRIDVLITERTVFEYHLQQLSPQVDTQQPIVFHNIFPVYYPRLVFRDKGLRDKFDVAWQALLQQENGGA